MFLVMVLFYGRLHQDNLLSNVRFKLIIDLTGLQVSIEVLNNDMRPPIPKKTP